MKRIGITVFLLLAACQGPTRAKQHSGFLDDYSDLEPSTENPRLEYWQREDINLVQYDRIILDELVVTLVEGARENELPEGTLVRVGKEFREIIIEELSGYYTFTDQAGPNTLRIRIALNDLRPLAAVEETTTDPRVDFSESHIEAEAIDSATGARLAAGVEQAKGEGAAYRSTQRWSHVRDAMRAWAKDLLRWIDERSYRDD